MWIILAVFVGTAMGYVLGRAGRFDDVQYERARAESWRLALRRAESRTEHWRKIARMRGISQPARFPPKSAVDPMSLPPQRSQENR